MSTRYLPIKNIIRLNWILSFLTALLFFIFLLAVTHDIADSLGRFLENFAFMCILSFSNLFFLRLFSHENAPRKKFLPLKFYICSYLSAIVIWLFVRSLHSFFTGLPWEGEGKFIVRAYSLAILAIWVFNTLIIVLQGMVVLQHNKAKAEIENLQLKANVSETANLLLRQQIHPHFLFNALNTVKSLYKKDMRQGEEYLVHLANFLRASVSNHTTKTTSVKSEVDFCVDYLKMQKIRFGEALNYSINISEDTLLTKYLPFFSLQPLAENALKHNELTEENPITINITEANGRLLVSNNLQLRTYKEASTGQGLLNLAERYRLLGEPGIDITSENSFFTVSLKILNK
jgi:two-component system LytT family sensor kinase